MANHYDIPKWAGKPPVGLHLDVLKDDKLVQKLMVDEKKCYLFGRNSELNDFCIDHASCSRVHSAMVYHKHLNRAFLVDLGSRHGTFIGSIRLESTKPTQLPVGSQFHFGASTRIYILRERPQANQKSTIDEKVGDEADGGLLGLPETELELDNLTEFNTAHNRRISMLGIVDEEIRPANRMRKNKGVTFNEDEEVINPEDIDPSIGRFRNLVQTSIVPTKRKKTDGGFILGDTHNIGRHTMQPLHYHDRLYGDLPGPGNDLNPSTSLVFPMSLSSKMGLNLPNPAPDVDNTLPVIAIPTAQPSIPSLEPILAEPKKKKYAKEAWPGKKPAPSLLM